MRRHVCVLAGLALSAAVSTMDRAAWAAGDAVYPAPAAIVVDGVPPAPAALAEKAGRYFEFRSATFLGFDPRTGAALVTTRFGDTPQLHLVASPGAARRQLTFAREPVRVAHYAPVRGDALVYEKDKGGDEFYQLYRFDPADGSSALLTDGASRNRGAIWSRDGAKIAYTSTRRDGTDTDVYVMDPRDPSSDRMALQVEGGGWEIQDWSADGRRLLIVDRRSINDAELFELTLASGEKRRIGPPGPEQVAYGAALYDPASSDILATTDRDAEMMRLVRLDAGTGAARPATGPERWGAEAFAVTRDGRTIAYVTNEAGVSALHVIDAGTLRPAAAPKLPPSVIGGLEFDEAGDVLGMTVSGARSPSDVFTVAVGDGAVSRWTTSETGGVPADRFVEPSLVTFKSFDGLEISGFMYRPDPARFPGRRPLLISIHGGPEGQARPTFLGRVNFLIDELGIAVFEPNVRGSDGYGKTFLDLDNGRRREDAVHDVGVMIARMKADPGLDPARFAVIGGSYGGYMSLAVSARYHDQLRAGVDIVGISNFVTFLRNTQSYRRDLRRVEYGDERDPEMAAFLERISPTSLVADMTNPMFVVAGQNDPRVPPTEAEQMVEAIRAHGGTAWHMVAKDEGHGFQKKPNADYLLLSVALFLQTNLLN